jgi:hypothetical protein
MPFMPDQNSTKPSQRLSGPDKTAQAPIVNKGKEKKNNFLDITALIRSIQRAEGNIDCFRSGQIDCDKVDCAWRQFCLENAKHST